MENAVSSTLEVPQGEKQSANWEIRGEVPAAPVSTFYKLGMAAVAIAMILLPLLYVGLIVALGWALYRHAVDDLSVFETTRNAKGALALYLGPLVIGGLVLVFMIKPLFARRPKSTEPRTVTREQEPKLFAFIDRICDLVHAPRPSRVQLDLQVNASASFRRGLASFFGQDLTLTIGLPLVAGLNTRQLGGVLAHEFGHFAQGAGMRLTYVIRTVNGWFSRVVYERDAWDENLTSAAQNIDLRIGVFLHAARFMIWLTRKVLWVFMMVGHGISCFMSRQMEFDADHYETQVSGSRGFGETAARLRQLNVAWHRSISQQQEAFQGKRLVDNLPGLVALESRRLSPDIVQKLDESANESNTGWFDTHPADSDRTRAAERAQCPGVMVAEGPATELFTDFATTAQLLTGNYYKEECELELDGVQFQSLEAMNSEAAERDAGHRAMEELFGELLSIRTFFFLSAEELDRPANLNAELRQRHRASLAKVPEPMKRLMEADGDEVLALQARALLSAGFTIKKAEFKLAAATPDGVNAALKATTAALEQSRAELEEAVAVSRERFSGTLRLLGDGLAPDATEAAREARKLLSLLGRFTGTDTTLVALRNNLAALRLLLHNGSDDARWGTTADQLGDSIQGHCIQFLNRFQDVDFPFSHGRGSISMADYLRECAPHENKLVQTFLHGDALYDKLINIYQRTLARLAVLAQRAEAESSAAPAQSVTHEPPLISA